MAFPEGSCDIKRAISPAKPEIRNFRKLADSIVRHYSYNENYKDELLEFVLDKHVQDPKNSTIIYRTIINHHITLEDIHHILTKLEVPKKDSKVTVPLIYVLSVGGKLCDYGLSLDKVVELLKP